MALNLSQETAETVIAALSDREDALIELFKAVRAVELWSNDIESVVDSFYRTRLRQLFAARQPAETLIDFSRHLNATGSALRRKNPDLASRLLCYANVVNDAIGEINAQWIEKTLAKDHVKDILRLLARNAEGAVFVEEIEREFGLKPANTSRVLALMQSVGFVSRMKVGRNVRVLLTPFGRGYAPSWVSAAVLPLSERALDEPIPSSHALIPLPSRDVIAMLGDYEKLGVAGWIRPLSERLSTPHDVKALAIDRVNQLSNLSQAEFRAELMSSTRRFIDRADTRANAGRLQAEAIREWTIRQREELLTKFRAERPEHYLLRHFNLYNIRDAAAKAKDALKTLNYAAEPFRVGVSEYHQDRLFLNLANAALGSEGFDIVKSQSVAWGTRTEAFDVSISAGLKGKGRPISDDGIYDFKGLSLFVRSDALRDRHVQAKGDEKRLIDQLLSSEPSERLSALSDDSTARIRATIAIELGLEDTTDPGIKDLYEGVVQLAGTHRKAAQRRQQNHKRFLNFLRGESNLYCGGAINARLLHDWWSTGDDPVVVQILDDLDIKSGLARRVKCSASEIVMENFIQYGGALKRESLDKSKSRAAKLAKKALVQLYREIGSALSSLSVSRHNGDAQAAEAAFLLLSPSSPDPMAEPRDQFSGQWSFVSSPIAAVELATSGDHYFDVGGR